jgi:hypothetical protein
MSDNATLDVMSSDVVAGASGQGSPFFPTTASVPTSPGSSPIAPTSLTQRVAGVVGLSRADLQAATTAQIQQVLQELLGALKNMPQAQLQLGERHGDGSLRITSHLAVWLIGKITDAYGGRLVRLAKVSDHDNLRSLNGLAQLLNASITKDQGAGDL